MQRIKSSIFLFILTILSGIASAQQKTLTGSMQFHSLNSIGLLEGETGSAFQLQTVNGIQCKSWFAGIGLGLDFYRLRTIPLFADIRKEFGKGSNKLFAYADLGINFSWVTDQQKTNYVADDKFNNGFYSDIGFGYKIGIGQKNNLLLSLGYSFKKTTETYSQIYYPPGIYYQSTELIDQEQKINYSLNRLSIKIGWEF